MEHQDMYRGMVMAWAVIFAAWLLTTVYNLVFEYGLKLLRRVVGRPR